ncbi:MAG TPA: PGPGW domain-containing protein [Candidatus Saccharimonadales bacterium]
MERLKRAWQQTPRPLRQSLVLVVGSLLVVAGLAMLVLPGPGWAAIFLGFAILATEFAIAERIRDRMVHALKAALAYGKRLLRHSRH